MFSIDKYYSPKLVCTGCLLGLATGWQGMSKKKNLFMPYNYKFNICFICHLLFCRYDRLF